MLCDEENVCYYYLKLQAIIKHSGLKLFEYNVLLSIILLFTSELL